MDATQAMPRRVHDSEAAGKRLLVPYLVLMDVALALVAAVPVTARAAAGEGDTREDPKNQTGHCD